MTALCTLLGAATSPSYAGAEALYWSKFPVNANRESSCLSFASDTADHFGLQNKRVSSLEVAGAYGSDYVSITCVGRGGGQEAMAIVMVMGPAQDDVISLRDQLATYMRGIFCYEGC